LEDAGRRITEIVCWSPIWVATNPKLLEKVYGDDSQFWSARSTDIMAKNDVTVRLDVARCIKNVYLQHNNLSKNKIVVA